MIIKIARYYDGKNQNQEFEIEKGKTLLAALVDIKTKKDNSVTFRSGCKSGVCGSCAVRVNKIEKLACKYIPQDGDLIEPLKAANIIKDLVIDLNYEEKKIKDTKSYLESYSGEIITKEDEKKIDRQSNCILCHSCYSSCPVFLTETSEGEKFNGNFIGPFALSRVLRYVNDKKESNIKDKIDAIQVNGIWDCTLCGNCSMVCPQMIDIKSDIMNLRNKSYQFGYTDPNLANFNSTMDFGFNPNGF